MEVLFNESFNLDGKYLSTRAAGGFVGEVLG